MNAHCPVAHEVDLFAPFFRAQLYDILGRLRDDTPVAYLPEHDLYVVTRYDDVQRIFDDNDNFSALNASSPLLPLVPEAARILRENVPRKPALTNADAPRHTQMRAAVSACLAAPRWRKLQPQVRKYGADLVASLVQKPVSDLVADLTFPLPRLPALPCLAFRLRTLNGSRNGAATGCCCPMAGSMRQPRSRRHIRWSRSGVMSRISWHCGQPIRAMI